MSRTTRCRFMIAGLTIIRDDNVAPPIRSIDLHGIDKYFRKTRRPYPSALNTCTHKTPLAELVTIAHGARPGTIDGGGLENNALRRKPSDGQVEPDTSPWLSYERRSVVLPVEVRRGAQINRQTSPGDPGMTHYIHIYFATFDIESFQSSNLYRTKNKVLGPFCNTL